MQERSVEQLLEAPAPAAKAKQPTSSPYVNRMATADQALMEKERAKSSQGISSRRPHSPDEMSKRNSAASQDEDKDANGDWTPYVQSPMRAGPGGYNDCLDSTGSKIKLVGSIQSQLDEQKEEDNSPFVNKRATFSPQLDVANEVAAAS